MSRPKVIRLKLDVIAEFKAKHAIATKYRPENILNPWLACCTVERGVFIAEGFSQVMALRKLSQSIGVECPL